MINFIITACAFLFLVTQEILLLNEESLILLCFIIFTVLGLNNLGVTISNSFQSQALQIEETLKTSLLKLLNIFNNFLNIKHDFKNLFSRFIILKNYYNHFVDLLESNFVTYNKSKLIIKYNKKLIFLNKVEAKTIKLLTFVIVKKLAKVIKIKQFYNTSLRISQFSCLNTISIRECIQLVNLASKN